MANLILAIIILAIFLLIIAETVIVRVTYTDEVIINIDFLLSQIILYPSRNRRKSRRQHTTLLKKFKKRIIVAGATKRAVDFFLKNSILTVHEINIPIDTTDPAKFVLLSQNASTLILMILTYLSLKSETLTSEDNTFISNNTNTLYDIPALDVTLKTGLYTVIVSALLFYVESKKIRRKQRQRFVRNKNE